VSAPVRALFYKESREGRWKYIVAALVLIALAIATPLLYDMLVGLLGEFFADESIPAEFRRLVPPGALELPVYLWANWHGKTLYQMMVLFALIFGASTVAGEFSRGSAPFVFSRAVRRRTVVLVKTAVDLGALALIALASTAALDVTARIAHGYAAPWTYYGALIPIMAGTAFVYGLSLLMSTRFDDPVKAGAAAAAVAALFSIPTLVPAWRRWSVYVHMTGSTLLASGTFPWGSELVIAALAALLLAAACVSLERRDI